jgi:hypothetical protein
MELGKFKMGKACIYVRRLSDINLEILENLSRISIDYIDKHHECSCRNGENQGVGGKGK